MSNTGIAPGIALFEKDPFESELNFQWPVVAGPATPEDFLSLKCALKASAWPFFDLALDTLKRRIVGPKGALAIAELDDCFEALLKLMEYPTQSHCLEKLLNAERVVHFSAVSMVAKLDALLRHVSSFSDHFLIQEAEHIRWNPAIRAKVLS